MTGEGLLLLIAAFMIIQSLNGMSALRSYWRKQDDELIHRAGKAFWWILGCGILLAIYPLF